MIASIPSRRLRLHRPAWRGRRRLPVVVAAALFVACSVTATALSVAASERSQEGARLMVAAVRERSLAERYANQVVLAQAGLAATPRTAARDLTGTVTALLHGGAVAAGAATGADLVVTAVTDPAARRDLVHEQRLLVDLVALGSRIVQHRSAVISLSGGERLTAPTPLRRLMQLAGLSGSAAVASARAISAASEGDVSSMITMEEALGVLAVVIAAGLGAAMVLASRTPASERERLERELSHATTIDPLTGLPNRLTFRGALDAAVARTEPEARPIALCVFDLDGFKLLNDTLGPDCGDELLRVLAGRLLAAAPQGAIVARAGGDEFAVMASGAAARAGAGLAEELLRCLGEPVALAGRQLRVAASAGLVVETGHARTGGALIRDAGVAMYAAKTAGGGCREYHERMAGILDDVVAFDHDLRAALAAGELEVHYQPQVDTADGRAVGVEALVRWRSPERGDVSPARLIAVAERSDLIRELGAFVLATACRQTAGWLRAGLLPDGFRVWVNVSCLQLQAGDVAGQVARVLAETELPAELLGLEVTETSVVPGGTACADAATELERVRSAGVRVAIDDFGTGYSSMAQLKQLPADVLKIDRAFVATSAAAPPATRSSRTFCVWARRSASRSWPRGSSRSASSRCCAGWAAGTRRATCSRARRPGPN